MPLDTSEFDKRIEKSKFSGEGATTKFSGQGEAVMQVALEVVKANFPDLVARTHTKVKAEEPPGSYSGVLGQYEYGLLTGDGGIKLTNADRISPATYSSEPKSPKSGLKPRSEVNFTTADVLRATETVLHEMYHGRSRAGFFNEGHNYSKLTPQQKVVINKIANAENAGFAKPLNTMNPEYLDEEEFMANADALLSMKERGLVFPGTSSEKRLATLQQIISTVPEAAAYIGARRQPNIPTLKAPASGTLGAIIREVDAMLNDYSVKETAGGAKPGTPRKKE